MGKQGIATSRLAWAQHGEQLRNNPSCSVRTLSF